ncbi:MAG: maleylpyruvate isomerase family mycothiol-dependent enzyme [Ilumatobacter sp.]|nr:maleylpyruvate isomerase family mycothiol-dependent enzyme [Ilumatobacter sp.]
MTSDLDRHVELAAQAHQQLLADLDRLIIDVAAPSRLPGWTKGHVLAHLVNSGDGHASIFDAAARGEIVAQYPHGPEGRSADIEAGASRPFAEQRDALRRSIWQLEGTWATSNWDGSGITPRGGVVALTELPFLRLREVAIHHIDLDIGHDFSDLADEYVRIELKRLEMTWAARQPMGMTPLPDAALALDPPLRLAWLTGRASIDGLEPAGVF